MKILKYLNFLQQDQSFSKEKLSPTTVVVPKLLIILGVVIGNKGKRGIISLPLPAAGTHLCHQQGWEIANDSVN